jgi:hypothetical protein
MPSPRCLNDTETHLLTFASELLGLNAVKVKISDNKIRVLLIKCKSFSLLMVSLIPSTASLCLYLPIIIKSEFAVKNLSTGIRERAVERSRPFESGWAVPGSEPNGVPTFTLFKLLGILLLPSVYFVVVEHG